MRNFNQEHTPIISVTVPKISKRSEDFMPSPPKEFHVLLRFSPLLYFSFLVSCNIFLECERFKATEPHFCFVPRGGRFVRS